MTRQPLATMRFRTQGLQSAAQATFGKPSEVRRHQGNQLKGHQGWDLQADDGTPCFAVEDGTIVDVGKRPDWGNYVKLQFLTGGKVYYAFYAHLSSQTVVKGLTVRQGSIIGYTGRTGNAAGGSPHLHFEIHSQASPPGSPTPGLGVSGRVDPSEVLGSSIFRQLQSH